MPSVGGLERWRSGGGCVDGNWVRWCAGEVGELSEQVRRLSAGLAAARAESWRSLAAEDYRATLEEQQHALAATAAVLDDARGALEAHARAVEEALEGPLGALAGRAADVLGLHL
jgi:hypothetical protein